MISIRMLRGNAIIEKHIVGSCSITTATSSIIVEPKNNIISPHAKFVLLIYKI